VGEHHGVVVDVDDAGFGCGGLGDAVDVVRVGDAGADVEELANACALSIPPTAAEACSTASRSTAKLSVPPNR
jgi:hypothetical protein